MLQFLSFFPPEIVLHHREEEVVVVIEIFLRVRLVRHPGTGSLHHALHSYGLHLLIVHRLRASGVDHGLSLYDRLPVNSIVIHPFSQLSQVHSRVRSGTVCLWQSHQRSSRGPVALQVRSVGLEVLATKVTVTVVEVREVLRVMMVGWSGHHLLLRTQQNSRTSRDHPQHSLPNGRPRC